MVAAVVEAVVDVVDMVGQEVVDVAVDAEELIVEDLAHVMIIKLNQTHFVPFYT